VFSAATLAFGVAQMVAPQVGGALADWLDSFTAVFLLSIAIGAVGAALSSRLPREPQVGSPQTRTRSARSIRSRRRRPRSSVGS